MHKYGLPHCAVLNSTIVSIMHSSFVYVLQAGRECSVHVVYVCRSYLVRQVNVCDESFSLVDKHSLLALRFEFVLFLLTKISKNQ